MRNERELSAALLGAKGAMTKAMMRLGKDDRVAIFALMAEILAPGEPGNVKGAIVAEYLCGETVNVNGSAYHA